MSRQNFISVCPGNVAGTACSGTIWNAGWILFEDDNADGAVDAGDTVLFAEAALGIPLTIRGTAQIASGVTFMPNGNSDLTATQTLVLCDVRGFGEDARGLIVTVVGHSSTLAADESGVASCAP